MDEVRVDFTHSRGIIPAEIYGHFAEHIGGVFYDGLWVGEDSHVENIRGFRKSLVDSFKKLNPPVLRWPGGCFAETYNWRDGIGPRAQRPRRINWWYHCDGRAESNQVGTHEFMDFCRMTGAEPYFAANMTSLTPLQIRDWIEYCNLPAGISTLTDERKQNGSEQPFDVRYWGIGNENWGGGGQMLPETCADEFIRYTTVFKSLGTEQLKFVMCGANGHDLDWTRRLLKRWNERTWHENSLWGLSVHYYTFASNGKDDVTFDEAGWYDDIFKADYMRHIVDDHRLVMDEMDPKRELKLAIDEWGVWHKDGTGPSKGYNLFEQQSNMRDAAIAGLTLNIFNNRCDVVGMANIAQLCNNLHSLYLAGGDNFVETPNYHVFAMYATHMGAKQLETKVLSSTMEREGFDGLDTLSASASVKDGTLTLTLVNLDVSSSKKVALSCRGGKLAGTGEITTLGSDDPNTCNTFEHPNSVVPVSKALKISDGICVDLPAASVSRVTLKLEEE